MVPAHDRANIKSAEEFIEREPEIECIRKEGMVKKRIVAKEIAWKEKYVSLTDDRLLLRNQPYGEIRDTIELRSVTHVRRMVESAHCAAVKGFNDSFRSDNSFKRKSSAQTSTPTFDQQASTEGQFALTKYFGNDSCVEWAVLTFCPKSAVHVTRIFRHKAQDSWARACAVPKLVDRQAQLQFFVHPVHPPALMPARRHRRRHRTFRELDI